MLKVGPLLICGSMGVRESQRSAKGRPHTLNGQAGGYQVIGPGYHPQRSRNGPRMMGHSCSSWQAQLQ